MKYYNGYALDDKETVSRTKFIVVLKGNLDVNNTYGFENENELKLYLEFDKNGPKRIQSIFMVEPMNNDLLF